MPKARITREMVVDAAFAIARDQGPGAINARTVSQALNCSTQPVLYYFSTIEDLRRAVFAKAEQYHTAYFLQVTGELGDPLLEIALRYIRFAEEEKQLFRFLFQSDYFGNRDLDQWSQAEKLAPVMAGIRARTGLSEDQAGQLFLSVYLTIHGYASLFACNSMRYDEESVLRTLRLAFSGAMLALEAERKDDFL